MAKRQILTFPDARLREVSEPVSSVTPEMKTLVKDMLDTMYAAKGIGLAAIQVGEPIRLLVIDTRPLPSEKTKDSEDQEDPMTDLEKKVTQPLVIFNPEIIEGRGSVTYDEGCLSVPTFYETVERFQWIKAKGLDAEGKEFFLETDGLLAICLQHEMDHLDGKLFIDRISFVRSQKIKNQIKKHGYGEKPVKKKEESAL